MLTTPKHRPGCTSSSVWPKRTRQNPLLKDVVPMPGDPEYDRLQLEKARTKAQIRASKSAATARGSTTKNAVKEKISIDPPQVPANDSGNDSVPAPAVLFTVKKSVIFDKTALLDSESMISSTFQLKAAHDYSQRKGFNSHLISHKALSHLAPNKVKKITIFIQGPEDWESILEVVTYFKKEREKKPGSSFEGSVFLIQGKPSDSG